MKTKMYSSLPMFNGPLNQQEDEDAAVRNNVEF